MPELIDRHALLKKVYEHPQERERMTDGEWCRKCIYEAPKVEAEPVRHGRWVFQKGDNKETVDGWICTACKYGFHTKVPYFEVFKYCPMCNARMDGGADNGRY